MNVRRLCLVKGRVPHISLVFREMWDTTALNPEPLNPKPTPRKQAGCPSFAKPAPACRGAYVGRKRRGDPDFLPRDATDTHVCGFHRRKPHGVHQRQQGLQEIRGKPPKPFYQGVS
jgi:hypothetical protein